MLLPCRITRITRVFWIRYICKVVCFVCFMFTWFSPCPTQEKNNLEIDLSYKLKTLQQRLEQEQTEHRVTRAQLTDKYESIEEAKSAAMNGMPVLCQSMPYSLFFRRALFFSFYHPVLSSLSFIFYFPPFSSFNFFLTPSASSCLVFLSCTCIRFPSRGGKDARNSSSQSACQDTASLHINAGLFLTI